jgi:hypothetical protein
MLGASAYTAMVLKFTDDATADGCHCAETLCGQTDYPV